MNKCVLPMAAILAGFPFLSGCAADSSGTSATQPVASSRVATHEVTTPAWPRYTLRADQTWQLNLPGGQEFDASGLAITREGELLTINDRGATVYRIQFLTQTNAADLIPLTNCFTAAQLKPFQHEKAGRYDCEGVAADATGRLYICEEANRWILRCDPGTHMVERLGI